MPLKVPSEVRALVIRDWLSGKPREADVNKYGSFKKALEVLDQKSRNLESQKKDTWTSWTSENPLLEVDIGDIRR